MNTSNVGQKTESSPCGDFRRVVGRVEAILLGFGKYHDWRYGEILTETPHYVTYICSESEDVFGDHQKFTDWITLKGRSIEKNALSASSRSK